LHLDRHCYNQIAKENLIVIGEIIDGFFGLCEAHLEKSSNPRDDVSPCSDDGMSIYY